MAVGDKEWLTQITGLAPKGRMSVVPVEYSTLPDSSSIPLELREPQTAYVLAASEKERKYILRKC